MSTSEGDAAMADKAQDKNTERAAPQEPTVDPQQVIDAQTEHGFRGIEVDPTPNDHYTVAGVTSGKPTPETDDDQAEKARQALAETSRRAAGVAEK